jgi:hypothetical protein
MRDPRTTMRNAAGTGMSRPIVLLISAVLCLSGGSARAASVGDVNASGGVDVSDAIALLQHLFADGPPPARLDPCAGLPVTGAVTCYGDGSPIACPAPGTPHYGQDGIHRTGRPRDFVVVKPEPADASTWFTIDHATGLAWQYRPDSLQRTWREALSHARSLRLGGHDDWRLPNISELLSILSFDSASAALDPAAFSFEPGDPRFTVVWSSTTAPWNGGASDALVVDFARGTVHTSAKDPGYAPAYSRAVRTIEPVRHGDLNGDGSVDLSDPIRLLLFLFVDSSLSVRGPVSGLPATGQTSCFDSAGLIACAIGEDGGTSEYAGQDGHARAGVPRLFEIVKPDPTDRSSWYTVDHATALAWQHDEALVKMSWPEALAHCEDLELGGFDDWRLPNVRELQSIADYGRYPAAPDELGRESLDLEGGDHWGFWSSTPGFSFYMDLGFVFGGFPESGWVRAVRTVAPESPR